jgi:formylglycine-generating enzyme required for sulfatase activity
MKIELSTTTIDLIKIPSGKFLMGSPTDRWWASGDELPRHEVTINPFLMGETPVTQAQWRAVVDLPKINWDLDPNPSYFSGDDHPVELVSVPDAVEFCDRLSRVFYRQFRLPSEAEWEYACRAGTMTRYSFGDEGDIGSYAWHEGNSGGQTHPVKQKKANPWGLYDMHGNVLEWCQDIWHDNYEGAPTDGRAWDDTISVWRVARGGSWDDHPIDCRSAYRAKLLFNNQHRYLGFRAACDLT